MKNNILVKNKSLQGKNVKPYGAVAVLIFSDPYDSSADGEQGYPNDPGIPEDTVQRGHYFIDYISNSNFLKLIRFF